MLEKQYQEEVVELLTKMIQSSSISGNEAGVVAVLKDYMQSNGFDEVYIDEYGTITGTIRGEHPGKKILFDGHIDTVEVPAREEWTKNPFGAEIADGKMYGLGTTDMKGAVAAMTVAAAMFARKSNKKFAGEIHVAGVVHEETFEGVAARSISSRVKPDYVIIGEPSRLNLKVAQKGRAEIVLETEGVPAHSSNPEKGVNAVILMTKLINEIEKFILPTHPVQGKGVLALTDIVSTPYPGASVIPTRCRATYDRRTLVGETKESVLAPFEELIAKFKKDDPTFKAKVYYAYGEDNCYTGNKITAERFFPAWLFEKDEEFVLKVVKKFKEMGLNPNVEEWYFCTNGSHYAGEKGIKTLGYGPSKEWLAHTIDEYIELDELFNAIKGYTYITESLLEFT